MKKINMEEYESKIVNSKKPVIIDFYADWCGPCKMLGPVMEQLDAKYQDKAEIVKVDVDVQRALAMKFEVMSIPTVVMMKDGKVVDRSVGAKPISYYESLLDKAI